MSLLSTALVGKNPNIDVYNKISSKSNLNCKLNFTEEQLSPMMPQLSSTPLSSQQPEMAVAGYDVIVPSDVIVGSSSNSRDEVNEDEAVNSIYRVALEEEASARCLFHILNYIFYM